MIYRRKLDSLAYISAAESIDVSSTIFSINGSSARHNLTSTRLFVQMLSLHAKLTVMKHCDELKTLKKLGHIE